MTDRPVAIEHETHADAPGYHAFLLRLWCDADRAGWHASLQAPAEAERRGFGDLRALMEYLQHLCSAGDSSAQPANNS